MDKVYEFLKKCGVYYLATVEADQPRVRPFGTVNIYEGKLYFQTGKVKPVASQLKANPKVEISGMSEGKWIRVCGKAVLDNRLEAAESMLDAYPHLKKSYTAGDGNTEVYYLEDVTATICSFADEPEVIKF